MHRELAWTCIDIKGIVYQNYKILSSTVLLTKVTEAS